jgi:GT2 family glycosyltransferase
MAEAHALRVHIVILNYKGALDTIECVASIKGTTFSNFEIVVVDNDSGDGSEDLICAAHPDITVLQSGANLGYAGGNNIGIRYALARGADFIWILNNDTTVAPDALGELLRAAAAAPGVGIVGSKIYYMAEPTLLWFAGGRIDWLRGIPYHVGAHQEDRGQFDGMTASETAQGASMLVSRETFERVGLLEEDYFLYFEESDFCCRARKAGLAIRFAPASHVWHGVSRSTGVRSPIFLYYFTRNNIIFIRRHKSFPGYLISLPFLLKRSLKNVSVEEGGSAFGSSRLRLWWVAWMDGLFGRTGRKKRLASA